MLQNPVVILFFCNKIFLAAQFQLASDASLVKTGGAGTLLGSELEQQFIMFHDSMNTEVLRGSCRSETARVWACFPASQRPGVFDRFLF